MREAAMRSGLPTAKKAKPKKAGKRLPAPKPAAA